MKRFDTSRRPFTAAASIGLGACLLAASAVAEAGPRRGGFHAAGPEDRNRDGVVTRAEMKRFHLRQARSAMLRLDRNRDGWITGDELRPRRPRDLNRDGVVTPVERRLSRQVVRRGLPVRKLRRIALRQAARRFDRLDVNLDGVLTRPELRWAGSPGARGGWSGGRGWPNDRVGSWDDDREWRDDRGRWDDRGGRRRRGVGARGRGLGPPSWAR